MTLRQLGLASVALTAAAVLATQVSAQPARQLMLTGAVPSGLCFVDGDRAIGDSTVGKYLSGRMQELNVQANAELDAVKAPIQTEFQTLETQRPTLAPAAYQSRNEALQERAANFERTRQIRQRELQDTAGQAAQTIEQQLVPIIQQVAIARHCTMVLSATALILPNAAADITDPSIAGLNLKLTSFPIERERLDVGAPGAR